MKVQKPSIGSASTNIGRRNPFGENVSKLPKLYESNYDSYSSNLLSLDSDSKMSVLNGNDKAKGCGYGDIVQEKNSYEMVTFSDEAMELYRKYLESENTGNE